MFGQTELSSLSTQSLKLMDKTLYISFSTRRNHEHCLQSQVQLAVKMMAHSEHNHTAFRKKRVYCNYPDQYYIWVEKDSLRKLIRDEIATTRHQLLLYFLSGLVRAAGIFIIYISQGIRVSLVLWRRAVLPSHRYNAFYCEKIALREHHNKSVNTRSRFTIAHYKQRNKKGEKLQLAVTRRE